MQGECVYIYSCSSGIEITNEVKNQAAIRESTSGSIEVCLAVRELADQVYFVRVGVEQVSSVSKGVAEAEDRRVAALHEMVLGGEK